MTNDKKSGKDTRECPAIGERLSRNELMDVLMDEGCPAGAQAGSYGRENADRTA